MNLSKSLRLLGTELLDLVMPQECLGCGKGKTWLCANCNNTLLLRKDFPCLICHRPAWQGEVHKECRGKTSLDGVIVASYQSQFLKGLVHSFKYENLQALAKSLAELMKRKIEDSPLFESLLISKDTLLIPVPLHRYKQWDRGFNQTELLAQDLVKSFPVTLSLDVVRRVRNTTTQTDLPRHKRLGNLTKAFEVTDSEVVKNRTVVLIDDVLTTGTTLSELARELKKSKAHEVWALVLARG